MVRFCFNHKIRPYQTYAHPQWRESMDITVKSVEAHSVKQGIWKPTSALTPEKNHTSAHNAVTQVAGPMLSNDTWPNIQKKITSFGRFFLLALLHTGEKTFQYPRCSLSSANSSTHRQHLTKHLTAIDQLLSCNEMVILISISRQFLLNAINIIK